MTDHDDGQGGEKLPGLDDDQKGLESRNYGWWILVAGAIIFVLSPMLYIFCVWVLVMMTYHR